MERAATLNASPHPDGADQIGALALRARIQARLAQLVPGDGSVSEILTIAARSALLSGGKRVRPTLTVLVCEHFGGQGDLALDYACAIELVHTASLVLDDLPCMDDAAFRRSQPTTHRSHGEDAAVLAAIALLNQAHRVILADPGLANTTRLALLDALTESVGFMGLAAGQMRDLRDPASSRTEDNLRSLNHQKTGALFVAAFKGAALISSAGQEAIKSGSVFGERIGFAFQLFDDLNDAVSTMDFLGKDVGQDRHKRTFVDLWGVDRVRAEIVRAIDAADDALDGGSQPAAYVRALFRNAGFAF